MKDSDYWHFLRTMDFSDSEAILEGKHRQSMRALAMLTTALAIFTAMQIIGFNFLARSADLLNWEIAKISIWVNIYILSVWSITWLINYQAKKRNPNYMRIYYQSMTIMFTLVMAGWLAHIHFAGSSITLLTISIPATAFLANSALGSREGWYYLIYGTIGWILIMLLEKVGGLSYFPLYIHAQDLPKDFFQDLRFIAANVSIYAVLCVAIMGLMRRFQKAIEQRNEELAQAKKEIEKTLEQRNEAYQALAGVAHDVKNIVTGLEGGGGLVNEALKADNRELLKAGWEIVEVSQGRMKRMVLNMLDYSKERKPNYEQVDLTEIIGNVADLVRLQRHDYPVTVEQQIDPRAANIDADGLSIHRCILNLASNAADALAANPPERPGKITLRTRPAPEAGFVAIDVNDNGPGIAEEKITELFEAFKSSKGAKGTGLGLAVSRKIAKEHGGNIAIESQVDDGATFTILLPEKEPVVI